MKLINVLQRTNINDVSTTTFRSMKFDGLILFEELNGCLGNAYRIDKGVVMAKLQNIQSGQIVPRCGITWAISTSYWINSGGTETYQGPGPVRYETEPSCDPSATDLSSYDLGLNNGSLSGSGGASSDSYYSSYLGSYTISTILRICPATFQFQAVTTSQTSTNRWEGGMMNDGFQFTPPTGPIIPVGFNYVTFSLPMTNSAYNVSSPNQIVADQINATVNQIQQQINMPGNTISLTSTGIGEAFWAALTTNLARALGTSALSVSRSDSPKTYRMDNFTQTLIYNRPVIGACP